MVEKILISKSEKIIDPAHIVSLDTPVIVCEQFGCFYVCVILQPQVALARMQWRSQYFFIGRAHSLEWDFAY